jgi:hypothetical protein
MEDIKIANYIHTNENAHDCYKMSFEFNRTRYPHIRERLIIYYLLQSIADEIEDIEKIRQVINDDDFYLIEHPTKYTSIIEIVCK